ncbi:MAG: sigma-70 family RNA polymerase sigma factor [Anaerolineales bacterium]|nr:sigma-70 family RNA polymerase sigma factor [Anaerolineales bacterium]MCX7754734.1 sigma-70 family RNA polymerase sigma factor [Anaerolineales bacterium]MDW8277161.1 sigma-70 family RNA polymerase sigma factor [Anaerolineales bacterium]
MNPRELIESARNGDLSAFNELVLKYQNRLYHVAFRMLGDEDVAEDAVQNTFVLAFRGLKHYRGGSFDFWLLRILKNVCYDELRRLKRQATCTLEPWLYDDDENESPHWLADWAQDPCSRSEQSELEQVIQAALLHLSPEYRLVLTLVDIEGLDYAEAALVLRVPLGTVKSRLARARLRLRQTLCKQPDLLPSLYAAPSPRPTASLLAVG